VSGASANTVIATIVTAEASTAYIGRFAPSPTGPLHLGSLTTALASCLEARVRGGRWRLRIEDVDTSRALPGVADQMLVTLESLGFTWDGPVIRQSARTALYAAAVEQLRSRARIYPCGCSRRQLAESEPGTGYPGTCRAGPQGPAPHALRFRMDDRLEVAFDDELQGRCAPPRAALGDPIVVRRDTLHAYHLAVVVDDAECGITHVVRGCDLLDSTLWQRQLQQALGLPAPNYLHLPLVTNLDGSKLSKSTHPVALDVGDRDRTRALLYKLLTLLKHKPPTELESAGIPGLWGWALKNWNVNRLRGVQLLPAN
jgi:glutamyl-Q tRNA(Asp) synthetase